jgi:predicted O-methyltransferase YrrM
MTELWTAIDRYLCDAMVPSDAALDAALEASTRAGLPSIHVAPNQGKLLQLLARIQGARTILELGTLGGYSTIWLARALSPGGRLVTLELDPRHAAVAAQNLERAGLAAAVELRVGRAEGAMAELAAQRRGPFDFIFIDADKENDSRYLEWAVRLGRPGATVVLDNTVWEGALLDPAMDPVNAPGIIDALKLLGEHPRLDATVIQTVGSKGWDGFALARIK